MGLAHRAGPFSCKPEEGRACYYGGKNGKRAYKGRPFRASGPCGPARGPARIYRPASLFKKKTKNDWLDYIYRPVFNVYLDFCLKNLLFILTVRLYVLVYVVMLSLITLSDYVMTYDYVYCDVIRWFYFAKTIKRTGRIRLKEEKVDLGKKI